MGINNEVIINRRQLLVRAGSFMKLSWRKSREKLFDQNEDNSNLRHGRRRGKNLSISFCDESLVTYFTNDEPLSDEDIENMWYQVRHSPFHKIDKTCERAIVQYMFSLLTL